MNTTLQSQLAPYVEECRQRLLTAAPERATATAHEVSAQEKKILAEAHRALKAWEASPEGQAKLQALKGMSLAEIQQELSALLQSQIFASTLELISAPSLPILKYPIQSVWLAAKVEAEVIIGFSGSIGAAIEPSQVLQFIQDPKRGTLSWQYFISGWFDDGITGGAFVGIEFGISGSAPSDLGGFGSGVEGTFDVDPDTGLGISAQYYHGSADESWGATVAVVEGADAGFEGTQSYTILLGQGSLGLQPIYQPDAAHMLIITQITCVNANRNPDGVYFYFTPDSGTQYRYPTWDHRDMTDDDDDPDYYHTWYPGRSVKFNGQVTVALWSEQDADTDPLGDAITFYYDDFANVHSDTEWKKVYRAPDAGNGWNEIEYHVYAQLIY